MKRPYIGITDFMNYEQVRQMLTLFNHYRPAGYPWKLHVGVMMSRRTLNGQPSKYTHAFPKTEDIASIFQSKETVNCLHYADYGNDPEFAKNLAKAISYGGAGMNALQLDMCWPDPKGLKQALITCGRNIDVILQVGTKSLEEANNDPDEVLSRINEYGKSVNYVLLDKSVGKGLPMNPNELLRFARVIAKERPDLNIVVAGGLCAENIHLIEPIHKEIENISIDAEGQLRPSKNVLDPIDWSMAGDYIISAIKTLTV